MKKPTCECGWVLPAETSVDVVPPNPTLRLFVFITCPECGATWDTSPDFKGMATVTLHPQRPQ